MTSIDAKLYTGTNISWKYSGHKNISHRIHEAKFCLSTSSIAFSNADMPASDHLVQRAHVKSAQQDKTYFYTAPLQEMPPVTVARTYANGAYILVNTRHFVDVSANLLWRYLIYFHCVLRSPTWFRWPVIQFFCFLLSPCSPWLRCFSASIYSW